VQPQLVQAGFALFRGPGALDPSGRITRGVSTIREPLPLLANLVGVTLSPGARTTARSTSCPATTSSRAHRHGHAFSGNPDGTNGLVLIDKDNVTLQASVYGRLDATTPSGLIAGTAPGWSYNPDVFDGTLNGAGSRTRTRSTASRRAPVRATTRSRRPRKTRRCCGAGVAIVPNLLRGSIAGFVTFLTRAAVRNRRRPSSTPRRPTGRRSPA